MKKIMFNNKYGLTEAVLEGRKTMTRRIIKGDFEDIKAYHANGGWHFITDTKDGDSVEVKPAYEIGEKVAVAQRYWDLSNNNDFYEALQKSDPSFPLECIKYEKGCHNKMFVRADWMPHRIRITDIKVERLQDISNKDCIREGITEEDTPTDTGYSFSGTQGNWETPRAAFAVLIDKVSGRGTWNRNPWVFAYTFKLVQ